MAACAGPTAAPIATVLMAIAAEMATRVRFNEELTNICFLPFGGLRTSQRLVEIIQGLCQSRKSVIHALKLGEHGKGMPQRWVNPPTLRREVRVIGMFSDEVIATIVKAIKSEVAQPLGAMRHLRVSEEELALAVLNALDEVGFDVIRREQQPSD